MASILKLIKNPAKIVYVMDRCGVGKFLSDRTCLALKYRAHLGKKLDLKDPKTFNEKLQWLKLYDRKPVYTQMVDKYEAKSYAAERIGEEYIIPTLGVWDRAEDIDFDALPNQFVLKCTHDSGGLVICRDKSQLDIEGAKKKLNKALKNNFYYSFREWPYKNVKPRIIAECYMSDENQQKGLTDYKFYCFAGVPKFLYVSTGLENHATAHISFLNLDWTFAPFQRTDYEGYAQLPPKPKNFEKMIRIAEELSRGIPFLRVDLYEINGNVYFSELTFCPCAGLMEFNPPQWDEKVGQWLELPEK